MEADEAQAWRGPQLDDEPYASFFVADEDVPEEVRTAARQPPDGHWPDYVASGIDVVRGVAEGYHLKTLMMDKAGRKMMKRAGMYPGGTLDRSKAPGPPLAKAGCRNGVDAADLEMPAVLQNPESGQAGITARVYCPEARRECEAKLPVVLSVHGGGFCRGSAFSATYDKFARALALALDAVVVAPEYRLAPEYPFPGGLLDVYDSMRWVASPDAAQALAETFGVTIDLQHVCLQGDSAGGNFILVLATLLRDGLQADLTPAPPELAPGVVRVVSLMPMAPSVGIGRLTHSELAQFPFLPPWGLDWYLRSYLGDDEESREARFADRRFCALAPGVAGLPHVTLVSGGRDTLQDEARILELALAEAGTPCSHYHYPKGVHVFWLLPWEPSKAVMDHLRAGWAEALDLARGSE